MSETIHTEKLFSYEALQYEAVQLAIGVDRLVGNILNCPYLTINKNSFEMVTKCNRLKLFESVTNYHRLKFTK